MVEDKGEGGSIETRVQRVEHAARHRHAVMRIEHRRRVGKHDRDRVAFLQTLPGKRRGETARACVVIGVGKTLRAVDDGGARRKDARRALKKAERGEGLVVRRVALQILIIFVAAEARHKARHGPSLSGAPDHRLAGSAAHVRLGVHRHGLWRRLLFCRGLLGSLFDDFPDRFGASGRFLALLRLCHG